MVWKKWGIWTPTEPIDAFKYIRFYFLSLFVLFSGTRNVCSIRSYHLVWVLFDNFILFMILISIRVLNIHRFPIEINVRRSSRWRRTRTSSKKREQEMPKFTWQHLLRIYLVSRVTMRRKNERTNKRATSVRSSILVEARNSRGFWLPVLHTTIHYILNVSSLSVVFVRRKYFLIWFGGNLAALRGATLPFSCDLRFAENVQISPHKLFSGRKCLRGRFHCDNRICEWSGGWMNRSRTMGFENLLETEFTSPAPMEMLNCFGWIRWPTLSFHKCNNIRTTHRKKTVYCLAKWVNNTDCNSSRNQMLI